MPDAQELVAQIAECSTVCTQAARHGRQADQRSQTMVKLMDGDTLTSVNVVVQNIIISRPTVTEYCPIQGQGKTKSKDGHYFELPLQSR